LTFETISAETVLHRNEAHPETPAKKAQKSQ